MRSLRSRENTLLKTNIRCDMIIREKEWNRSRRKNMYKSKDNIQTSLYALYKCTLNLS